MGSPKVKNCDQRLENTVPRPQAKGSIFKPEIDFFIFFSLQLIGLSLLTPLSGSESAYMPSTNDS